jgi:putative ABC transport system permease protein
MNLRNILITALRALSKNKLRSALTSIGIIIGISSVIVMVGMGNSARVEVREKVVSYGANAFMVYLSGGRTGKWLIDADLVTLRKYFSDIEYISPYQSRNHSLVRYNNKNTRTRLEGVSDEYFQIKSLKTQQGRSLIPFDISATAKVAVIGMTVKEDLFPDKNPVGEQILVEGVPLTIIGLLEYLPASFGGRDVNNVIDIPYTTFNIRFANRRSFDEIWVKSSADTDVGELGQSIMDYMIQKFNPPEKDRNLFQLSTSEDKLKTANDISNALAILLAGIASISLFVGGVGIMNIMLVSVTERTREIGIRMAIGAKKQDIMMQFLVESVILSLVGGVVGIILGLSLYGAITYFVDWPFIFSFFSVIVSVLFATMVGIFFGYYPAQKASDLKPIEALRFE